MVPVLIRRRVQEHLDVQRRAVGLRESVDLARLLALLLEHLPVGFVLLVLADFVADDAAHDSTADRHEGGARVVRPGGPGHTEARATAYGSTAQCTAQRGAGRQAHDEREAHRDGEVLHVWFSRELGLVGPGLVGRLTQIFGPQSLEVSLK